MAAVALDADLLGDLLEVEIIEEQGAKHTEHQPAVLHNGGGGNQRLVVGGKGIDVHKLAEGGGPRGHQLLEVGDIIDGKGDIAGGLYGQQNAAQGIHLAVEAVQPGEQERPQVKAHSGLALQHRPEFV